MIKNYINKVNLYNFFEKLYKLTLFISINMKTFVKIKRKPLYFFF